MSIDLNKTEFELFHSIRSSERELVKHVVGGGKIYFHKLDGKLLSRTSEAALQHLLELGVISETIDHEVTGRYGYALTAVVLKEAAS